MKKQYLYFISVCLFLISVDICGQDIAKPIDLTPLERPEYLTIIAVQNEDSDKLLGIIADSIRKNGYSDVRINLREQQIEADKHDVKDPRNYCKVLIWFERDFQQPDKYIKVYFFGGRFEFMIAKTSGIFRVKLSESMEEQYFSKLKNSIGSISKIN